MVGFKRVNKWFAEELSLIVEHPQNLDYFLQILSEELKMVIARREDWLFSSYCIFLVWINVKESMVAEIVVRVDCPEKKGM